MSDATHGALLTAVGWRRLDSEDLTFAALRIENPPDSPNSDGLNSENCGHGKIVLGAEMSGGITDATSAGCDFAGTDRGLRIKTRCGQGGEVARIRMTGVVMQDVARPLAINVFQFRDADGMRAAPLWNRGRPRQRCRYRPDSCALKSL